MRVNLARVADWVVLAVQLERLICDGVVTDQAELARMGHARLTRIMTLLYLAPDIQRRDAVTERELRPIAALPDWRKQRRVKRAATCLAARESSSLPADLPDAPFDWKSNTCQNSSSRDRSSSFHDNAQ